MSDVRRVALWTVDLGPLACGGAVVIAFAAPLFLHEFWIGLGALTWATAIGAVGLTLLFGRVGQLSLGHPFFLAIGAYGYCVLASPRDGATLWALGLPSLVAVLLSACIAAFAGFVLSPISARLKGLSLGLATLSLPFLTQWVATTVEPLSGGASGRAAPPLQIGSLGSANVVNVLGVAVDGSQFMWWVSLMALLIVLIFTRRLLAGRTGRAFTAIRESEQHAAILGIEAATYRTWAFVLSSLFAGLAGALLAVMLGFIVPEYWSLALAMSYLAMVVIGGLRSISGGVLGAALVTVLPAMLQRYGDGLPYLAASGGNGITPAVAAEIIYGLVLVIVLVLQPGGLVAIAQSVAQSAKGARR